VSDDYLIGEWFSDKPTKFEYKIFEKDHKIEHEWWGGYTRSNKIFRKIINNDSKAEADEELIVENKAIILYDPFLKQPNIFEN
jgi:vancomycin resistance protein VanW